MAEPEIAEVGECLYLCARVHMCFLSLFLPPLSLSLSLSHEITFGTFLA